MKTIEIFLITLIINLMCDSSFARKRSTPFYYIAGTIEFNYNPDIATNLNTYLDFIDEAKEKGVDILVFPESTLNHVFDSRKDQYERAIQVPEPADNITPWKYDNYSQILRSLSGKCLEKQIYVLVNLVEKVSCNDVRNACQNIHNDGFDLYNTNIVFDRNGKIISRYRKTNLYLEPNINVPESLELATFTTDFGVKFGHFICFDIVFKDPAISLLIKENVTNILYPSMWYSQLPFYTATQLHQGWAYANNVNLISAGANNPTFGTTGSGIYLGNKDTPATFMTSIFTNKLLVAKVPKKRNRNPPVQAKHRYEQSAVEMQVVPTIESWSSKNETRVRIDNQIQTICANENFCCRFNIRHNIKTIPAGKISYKYRLVANYTTSVFSHNREIGELYYAVVACTTSHPQSCGKRFRSHQNIFSSFIFESLSISVKIRYGAVNLNDVIPTPSSLLTSLLPLDTSDFRFESSNVYMENSTLYQDFAIYSTQQVENILTFGIYGRNFAADKVLSTENNL